MAQFRAKNDTFYNFSYIKKGKIVYGGDDLRNNEHFELVGDQGDKAPDPVNTGNGQEQPTKLTYKELCLMAKDLKIENYSKMTYPTLAKKVAEAQAKAAQPDGNEGNDGNDGGDSAGNADENKGNDGGNDTGDANNQ